MAIISICSSAENSSKRSGLDTNCSRSGDRLAGKAAGPTGFLSGSCGNAALLISELSGLALGLFLSLRPAEDRGLIQALFTEFA